MAQRKRNEGGEESTRERREGERDKWNRERKGERRRTRVYASRVVVMLWWCMWWGGRVTSAGRGQVGERREVERREAKKV